MADPESLALDRLVQRVRALEDAIHSRPKLTETWVEYAEALGEAGRLEDAADAKAQAQAIRSGAKPDVKPRAADAVALRSFPMHGMLLQMEVPRSWAQRLTMQGEAAYLVLLGRRGLDDFAVSVAVMPFAMNTPDAFRLLAERARVTTVERGNRADAITPFEVQDTPNGYSWNAHDPRVNRTRPRRGDFPEFTQVVLSRDGFLISATVLWHAPIPEREMFLQMMKSVAIASPATPR